MIAILAGTRGKLILLGGTFILTCLTLALWVGRFEVMAQSDENSIIVLDRWDGSVRRCMISGTVTAPDGGLAAFHSVCLRIFPADYSTTRG